MIVVAAILALFIGLSLGLLGGGGSILTVPMLVYVLGLDPKNAIATSLLVVGITSAAALIAHARAGRIRFKTGILFGLAGMVGAYGGGRLARYVPGTILLLAFAMIMIFTAAAMIRGRGKIASDADANAKDDAELPLLKVIADGVAVGGITGLVGAGGGFLIVPALVLLGRLPMRSAVGTSLLVIAMNSFASFLGHAGHTPVNYKLALLITAFAILGSLFGERFSKRIPETKLRRGFGWFVLSSALALLTKELPAALAAAGVFGRTTALHWSVYAIFAAISAFILLAIAVERSLPKPGHPKP